MGRPEDVAGVPESHTGRFLAEALRRGEPEVVAAAGRLSESAP
jgi:hypothetical protein